MKKIIRLTESQLVELINEIRFRNQERVDAALDKINSSGYDSLSDIEKWVLHNPDEEINFVELEPTKEEDEDLIISSLFHLGYIDEKDIKQEDDNKYVLSNMIDPEGYSFKYFEDGFTLELITRMSPDSEELLIGFDPGSEKADRNEIKTHINNNWGEIKNYLNIYFYVKNK